MRAGDQKQKYGLEWPYWIDGLTMQIVLNVKGTAGSGHNRDRGGCFIQVSGVARGGA